HKDKGILQIDYNFLNLPKYIKFSDFASYDRSNKVYVNTNYLYRADGSKIRKVHNYKDPSYAYALGTRTTDYLDGFQYEYDWTSLSGIPTNDFQLKFVPTSEGYFDFVKNKYIYNYTDHLGNIRLSYFNNGSGAEVLEENNYYPFGMKHEGYNTSFSFGSSYQYKYNGKELQTESGMYDYGARFYMADIGRWGVHDPLSELQFTYSPYSYAFNNPIYFTDPTGMIGEPGEPKLDPNAKGGDNNPHQIQEVIIKGHKKSQSAFSNIDVNKLATIMTPMRPATFEESAMINTRYGKCGHNDIGCDFTRLWKQIKDVPSDLAESLENLKSIGESEDKEEIVIATAILLVNLRKGKIGNMAKMGNLGGKFLKLAKLLKLNINSPTTISILENVDNTVQEFISTHRKGSIKAVFPAEYLDSTVKEALQSGNTTVRKLLTDSRFLK
ncbi:MAG: RHS repeat-associated core domain-containing protein, partial [Chryseobacterium gambrini]|nr:RHS repeat-associated core domain-containing protein [Chryseobacterium gambrini]